MIDLKKSIYTKLITVHSRVYDSIAPTNATYPYVNTRYVNVLESQESGVLRAILEIDIWDNIRDTTRLETLTEAIDAKMNREHDEIVYYKIFRNDPYRFEIDDSDEKIYHRQLRYEIHYVKK